MTTYIVLIFHFIYITLKSTHAIPYGILKDVAS